MTSKVYIVSKAQDFCAKIFDKKIFCLLLVAFAARLFLIGDLFSFDHDQEVPATAAYEFFINHKITLVGQELSFLGFFLGPLHSWLQFIPYGLCNLLPDCVPYFFLAISLITLLVLYNAIKIIFDAKTAFITTAISAISFAAISTEIGTNSNYFIFLSSIILLFSIYKYHQGQDKYLLLGSLVAGLATVNFNPVFIFTTLAFFMTALIRPIKNFKVFLVSGIAFLINYAPLVIFNFRHQNILLESISNFSNQNVAIDLSFYKMVMLVKNIMIPFYTNYLFQSVGIYYVLFTIGVLIVGTILVYRTRQRALLFLPAAVLAAFLGFIPYSGHIPDYYYQQTILSFIVLSSIVLRKSIALFIIVSTFFLLANTVKIKDYQSPINYQIKKAAVSYIIQDSKDKTFNLFIEMPRGFNTGYSYLIKAMGGVVSDYDQSLYILEIVKQGSLDLSKYQKAFPGKNVSVKSIGLLNIISVK